MIFNGCWHGNWISKLAKLEPEIIYVPNLSSLGKDTYRGMVKVYYS